MNQSWYDIKAKLSQTETPENINAQLLYSLTQSHNSLLETKQVQEQEIAKLEHEQAQIFTEKCALQNELDQEQEQNAAESTQFEFEYEKLIQFFKIYSIQTDYSFVDMLEKLQSLARESIEKARYAEQCNQLHENDVITKQKVQLENLQRKISEFEFDMRDNPLTAEVEALKTENIAYREQIENLKDLIRIPNVQESTPIEGGKSVEMLNLVAEVTQELGDISATAGFEQVKDLNLNYEQEIEIYLNNIKEYVVENTNRATAAPEEDETLLQIEESQINQLETSLEASQLQMTEETTKNFALDEDKLFCQFCIKLQKELDELDHQQKDSEISDLSIACISDQIKELNLFVNKLITNIQSLQHEVEQKQQRIELLEKQIVNNSGKEDNSALDALIGQLCLQSKVGRTGNLIEDLELLAKGIPEKVEHSNNGACSEIMTRAEAIINQLTNDSFQEISEMLQEVQKYISELRESAVPEEAIKLIYEIIGNAVEEDISLEPVMSNFKELAATEFCNCEAICNPLFDELEQTLQKLK